jgi:hypothetical protein
MSYQYLDRGCVQVVFWSSFCRKIVLVIPNCYLVQSFNSKLPSSCCCRRRVCKELLSRQLHLGQLWHWSRQGLPPCHLQGSFGDDCEAPSKTCLCLQVQLWESEPKIKYSLFPLSYRPTKIATTKKIYCLIWWKIIFFKLFFFQYYYTLTQWMYLITLLLHVYKQLNFSLKHCIGIIFFVWYKKIFFLLYIPIG